ncbi:MAG: DUF2309 family protein [Sandaracinaceae bacterium]|nr:DUF2309 family protein [Sandaracinaceae bacterium]
MTSLTVDTPTPSSARAAREAPLRLAIVAAIDAACARIAPAWPLDRLIAVNPYWGFVDRPIEDAAAHLTALSGTRLTMARSGFRARFAAGEFAERHLLAALRESGPELSLEGVLDELEKPEQATARYPSMVDWLDAHRDLDRELSFDDLVTRQLSQTCAAYADDAQASWSVSRDGGLYAAFRALLVDDESPRLLVGLTGLGAAAKKLPEDPRALIGHALSAMKLAPSEYEDYLTALLLSVLGWASAFAFTRWDARLVGRDDDAIVHLLAARLRGSCCSTSGSRARSSGSGGERLAVSGPRDSLPSVIARGWTGWLSARSSCPIRSRCSRPSAAASMWPRAHTPARSWCSASTCAPRSSAAASSMGDRSSRRSASRASSVCQWPTSHCAGAPALSSRVSSPPACASWTAASTTPVQ